MRDERGMALIVAIGVMAVLSVSAVTIVDYTTSTTHNSGFSKGSQLAYTLAEAGLNNAQSILSSNETVNGQPSSKALNSSVLTGTAQCPDGTSRCLQADYNGGLTRYEGGTTLWYGVLNNVNSTWTVTTWGQVHNPTGATASVIQRKIVADIKVIADAAQPANASVYNYLYATQSTTGCDVDLGQGVTVDYSIYAAGNLCLSNTATVAKPVAADRVELRVLGKLVLKSPQNIVGSSSTPIDDVETTGCGTSLTSTHTPCTGSGDKVWSSSYNYSPAAIVSPIDTTYWTKYYSNGIPGPKNDCTTKTGTVPVWDSNQPNGTLNLAGNGDSTFNITSSTAYSCVVKDYYGKTVGEFSWVPPNNGTGAPGTLTVNGTVYCDCSMTVGNGAMNVYNGYGTLYLTGTFVMTGAGTRLCASKAAGTTDCDFSGVFGSASQTEMLVIAANGNDSSGYSITMAQGTEFQGALLAIHNISIGQSTTFQGAVITPSISLGQSAVVKPLPVLQNLPLGAPGNPTTHATVQQPVVTSG